MYKNTITFNHIRTSCFWKWVAVVGLQPDLEQINKTKGTWTSADEDVSDPLRFVPPLFLGYRVSCGVVLLGIGGIWDFNRIQVIVTVSHTKQGNICTALIGHSYVRSDLSILSSKTQL